MISLSNDKYLYIRKANPVVSTPGNFSRPDKNCYAWSTGMASLSLKLKVLILIMWQFNLTNPFRATKNAAFWHKRISNRPKYKLEKANLEHFCHLRATKYRHKYLKLDIFDISRLSIPVKLHGSPPPNLRGWYEFVILCYIFRWRSRPLAPVILSKQSPTTSDLPWCFELKKCFHWKLHPKSLFIRDLVDWVL